MNQLYYGDNLDILREHIDDASVDLIYLDPPFNSNRSYNVLFKESDGAAADAQITAFDDTWHWNQTAEATLNDIEETAEPHVVEMIEAIVSFVGRNDMTAYLVMMCARLIELHRVLKPTGSLYLHCDPTASHYLKIVLDTIFGKEQFRNEIIWKRTSAHSDARVYGSSHDVLLYVTKSDEFTHNKQHQPYDDSYIKSHYRRVDDSGRRYRTDNLTAMGLSGGGYTYEWNGVTKVWRCPPERMQELHDQGRVHYTRTGTAEYIRYLDEMPGLPAQDVWDDISPINSQAKERLGYPTQKPLALLERIISASSNPGDLVLDPFCGCGTTITAAQKLGRQWIGIDITHLAVGLMRSRLRDMFGDQVEYEVVGVPADLASAEALARQDRFEFEHWALGLIGARSANQKKRGADKGLDGVLYFRDALKGKPKKVVVQVKSGHVQVSYIRDLCHVVEREKAVMGFLISLERPSQPMITEALAQGYYHSDGWNRDYPKIQIRTIEELLDKQWFLFPQANVTLSQAERVQEEGEQGELL